MHGCGLSPMTKIRRLPPVLLFAFLLMGFDAQDGRNWINGQWQGVVESWSLAVDLAAKTAIFIDGTKRVDGTFVIDEVVGRSVRFRIGNQQFTMHLQDRDNARLFLGNSDRGYWIQRVK